MRRARFCGFLLVTNALMSVSDGTIPRVSSVTLRRKVRSSVRGVRVVGRGRNSGQTAPSLIHCSSNLISLEERRLPLGGICSSSSLERMRFRRGLSAALPGTMAGPSDLPPLSAV